LTVERCHNNIIFSDFKDALFNMHDYTRTDKSYRQRLQNYYNNIIAHTVVNIEKVLLYKIN